MRYIGLFLSGICHQFPEHSLFIAGTQLPLCARCTGMYLGALVGLGSCWWRGRLKASWLPPLGILAVLTALFGFWAVDGVNSYLHYVTGRILLYSPRNALRLAVGLGNGLVLSAFTYPLFNFTLWKEPDRQRVIVNLRELVGTVLLLSAVGGVLLANVTSSLYPTVLLSSAGVVVMLTLVNSMIVLLLLRKENGVVNWHQAWPYLALGLACALAEVGGIAALRWQLAPMLPVQAS